jgi:hypothetical protein
MNDASERACGEADRKAAVQPPVARPKLTSPPTAVATVSIETAASIRITHSTPETPASSPATSGVATRKRPPTLTSDNQMTPKPNLALNAEIESSGRAANGTGNN